MMILNRVCVSEWDHDSIYHQSMTLISRAHDTNAEGVNRVHVTRSRMRETALKAACAALCNILMNKITPILPKIPQQPFHQCWPTALRLFLFYISFLWITETNHNYRERKRGRMIWKESEIDRKRKRGEAKIFSFHMLYPMTF